MMGLNCRACVFTRRRLKCIALKGAVSTRVARSGFCKKTCNMPYFLFKRPLVFPFSSISFISFSFSPKSRHLFFNHLGTPWTPAPVAEDYEETIQILLESHKVREKRTRKRGRRGEKEGLVRYRQTPFLTPTFTLLFQLNHRWRTRWTSLGA